MGAGVGTVFGECPPYRDVKTPNVFSLVLKRAGMMFLVSLGSI